MYINIGYQNMIHENRIVGIFSYESQPIKRMIQEAKQEGYCIDATFGRKTRSVIFTDGDYIILSALSPETLKARVNARKESPEF